MGNILKKIGNNIDFIGAISSTICLIYLVIEKVADLRSSPDMNLEMAIQNGIIIASLFLWGSYFSRRAYRYKKRYFNLRKSNKTIYRKIHSFCHAYRNTVTSDKEKFKAGFDGFLGDTCNIIKEIFDEGTGKNCGVSVKTLIDERTVIIAARDRIGHEERDMTSKFPIPENTALNEIHVHSDDCFCYNNLKEYPNYRNTNAKWAESYNCTLVAPIRRHENNIQTLVGYLSVDCKENVSASMENTEIIFKEDYKYLLGIFADALYPLFGQYLDINQDHN